MAAMSDLQKELKKELAMLYHETYHCQCAIDMLQDNGEKRLLELRYMDGNAWDVVMAKMHISRSTSYRLHIAALEDFWYYYTKVETL